MYIYYDNRGQLICDKGFSKKVRLDILCEESPMEIIHMKYLALSSLKNKKNI